MHKFQVHNSKFKRIVLLVFLLLNLIFLFLKPAALQASEPTATPSADLKSKLKGLQDEIASRAAKIKQDIGKKLQNRAYVGLVKSKSDSSLTLATKTGTKIITVNQDTEYQITKGKLSLKTINSDDYLVALGDIDENQVLTARKVIKLPQPEDSQLQTSFGYVTSTGDSRLTIQSKNNQLLTVETEIKTDFKFGKNNSDISDIKVSKPVIVVGTSTGKNTLKARFIYIFPYTSTVKPTTESSPSATPSTKPKRS